MKKAAFKIENYCFNKLSLDLSNYSGSDFSIDIAPEGSFSRKNQTFNLIFNLLISSEGSESAFVNITCNGTYKFEEQITFDEIPDYFYVNAVAILFPYVRAYISLITTQANVPGVILPTLNLNGLDQLLKERTKIED